jgi:uncharacterized membrane protein YebE (DUF533 family)
MAIEWRDICVDALLADGKIDETEIAVLKKKLKSSAGGILQEGATFLRDLRDAYTKKAKAKKQPLSDVFENYFFKTLTDYVLKDGEISEHEAGWLRDTLFADGKIDDREWKFLQDLKKKAKTTHSSFIQLYADAEKKRKKPAKK